MTRPDATVLAPSLTQAQIMGASFQGSLYNIRIYDNPIAQAQADRLVTADLQYAKNKNAMSRNRLDNPLAQYPLDGKDFNSYRKNKVDAFGNRPILAIEGTVTSVDNRNLRPNTALSLSPGSTLEYPPLFGDGYFNGYDAFNKKDQKGFTISFWVKVDNIAPTPAPYSLDKPFSKSDIEEDYFTGTDASGNKLFGIARIGNNLGIYRYIDRKGERYPWFLWMYDPMSFNGRKNGWYHIIWSQHQG